MKYVNAGNSRLPLLTLIAILSISLTINLPGLAVSPILAKLQHVFAGSTQQQAQLLTSLPNMCMIPVVLLAGRWAVKGNQTLILTLGLSIFLIAGILCFFASGMTELIILGCLIGVGCGLVVPLAAGYISQWFSGAARQTDLGLKSGTSNAMVVLATIYTGAIADSNWRMSFMVYVIPVIPLLLVPFLTRKYVTDHRRPLTAGEDEANTAKDVAYTVSKNEADEAPAFTAKQAGWQLAGIITVYLVATFATISISYYLAFAMDNYHMSTTQIGVVTGVYYLAASIGGMILSKALKLMRKASMIISISLCIAGLVGLGLFHNYFWLILSSFAMGMGYGFIQPIMYNKTSAVAPTPQLSTKFFGYVLTANYVGICLVPFIDNFVQKIAGWHNPADMFLFSAGLMAVILVWCVLKRKSFLFTVK